MHRPSYSSINCQCQYIRGQKLKLIKTFASAVRNALLSNAYAVYIDSDCVLKKIRTAFIFKIVVPN